MSLNWWSYDDELPKSTGSRRKGDDWGESYILFLERVCFKVNGDSLILKECDGFDHDFVTERIICHLSPTWDFSSHIDEVSRNATAEQLLLSPAGRKSVQDTNCERGISHH